MVKRTLTKEDVIKIESLFVNLNLLGTEYFRKAKKTVFLHSAPFVDQDAYHFFFQIVSNYKDQYVDIISMPLIVGSDYLRIQDMPNSFEEFNNAMTENELLYTGGLGFTDNNEVLFISCADTELVILDIPDTNEFDLDLFSPSRVSESEAENLVADHITFLKSANQ